MQTFHDKYLTTTPTIQELRVFMDKVTRLGVSRNQARDYDIVMDVVRLGCLARQYVFSMLEFY